VLLRGAGVSVGGTKVGLSVRRPCRKVYRACFVGNDGIRCRPGLQTRGDLSSAFFNNSNNNNSSNNNNNNDNINNNNDFLLAFQLIVLARYLPSSK